MNARLQARSSVPASERSESHARARACTWKAHRALTTAENRCLPSVLDVRLYTKRSSLTPTRARTTNVPCEEDEQRTACGRIARADLQGFLYLCKGRGGESRTAHRYLPHTIHEVRGHREIAPSHSDRRACASSTHITGARVALRKLSASRDE